MTQNFFLHTILSQPFFENTYILGQPKRSDVLVIDPGMEPDLILNWLADQQKSVAAILNTHGHVDHIAGNERLKQAHPAAPILIGAGDAVMLTDAWANLSGLFGMPIVSPPADRELREGDIVEAAGFQLEVLDVPGHSPGHIAYLLRSEPSLLFGGDVLMQGSIGRTDFPGGDTDTLFASIRDKFFTLPGATRVYPGHGEMTTIAEEKRSNPFVGEGV